MDADGAVLGRLASEVAKVLRGKHKPIFAPHMDTGDNVIVINARRIRLTGGKESEKLYHRHSGYPGGLRSVDYTRLLAQRPAVAIEKAVKGMLPKNRLGRQMLHKLAVYEGAEHPHQAQKPVSLGIGEIPKWEGLPAPKAKPERARRAREEKAGPGDKPQEKRRGSKAGGVTPSAAPTKRRAAAAAGSTRKAEGKTGETGGRTSRTPRRSRSKKES